MDVNGNDNSPEWGWCTWPGCKDAALPIWMSGDFPDDPDFLLCPTHIGSKMNALYCILQSIVAWHSYNLHATPRLPQTLFDAALKELGL